MYREREIEIDASLSLKLVVEGTLVKLVERIPEVGVSLTTYYHYKFNTSHTSIIIINTITTFFASLGAHSRRVG